MVMPTTQTIPLRFVNGVQQKVRPANLNPTDINFSDCASDMHLLYSVGVQGFSGERLEVWVSATSDCTDPVARGAGGSPTCWNVFNTTINQLAPATIQFDIPVRAIVGPLEHLPAPAGLVADQPISACLSQTSPVPVQFTLFILPIQAPATYIGTGFKQVLPVDLVGPPPPAVNPPAIGDGFLQATWTSNSDVDTVGYDVFFARVGSNVSSNDASDGTRLVCPDSGSNTQVEAGASCYYVGPAPATPSSACVSVDLSGSASSGAGTSSFSSTIEDGAVVEDASTVEGPGGVTTIPAIAWPEQAAPRASRLIPARASARPVKEPTRSTSSA
jgi:hypothetical protein